MTIDPAMETAIQERIAASAFSQWMGMRLISVDDGSCELAIDIQEHHLNPGGIVHGGIVATILDAAIGLALRTTIGMSSHVTVQLDVHYLTPAVSGALIGRGKAVRTGNRMGYGEGRAYTEDGRLVATAGATFLVVTPKATPAGD